MSRMRVLVCGSNYGRAYITAIAREPRKYQLAGILAQGSTRSQQVAERNGVTLYSSTDVLPGDIELACAAMSTAAWPVVPQLIRRGIHVLCEHPHPAGALKSALLLARKRGLQFHVNGHFAILPAPKAFIEACRRFSKASNPEFVEVTATERSLYAALDILMCAIGSPKPFRVRVLSRPAKFVLLEGEMGKIPIRFCVQASGNKGRERLADGSPGYLLDQRLTVAFPRELLTLLSTAGPVLCNRTTAHLSSTEQPLWTLLCDHQTQTVSGLREQRIRANVQALNSIRLCILGRPTPPLQRSQHILKVSQAWEHIGRQLYCA